MRVTWAFAGLLGAVIGLTSDPAARWTGDMILAGIVLSIWVLAETMVRRNWSALLVLPATAILGMGCGLPLYLFLRSRKVT